jgi:hypothetical protein
MDRGVDIPWVGGQNTMDRGGQYTMGRGVNIPWVGGRYTMGKGGSKYHG